VCVCVCMHVCIHACIFRKILSINKGFFLKSINKVTFVIEALFM
jgi:hypothetical protein